jgi:peptidoglycan/xylan/chitin deacetylase (PgdA/CDA1 family)
MNIYKKKFYHGIMFHHFHNDKFFKKSRGSVSQDHLIKIIKKIGRKNILDANDFIIRLKEKKLHKNNVCFSFDDGLKCQYKIALPILEDLQIKSFFFIFSSIFTNKADLLEVYRFFRDNYYDNINLFYEDFFSSIYVKYKLFLDLKSKNIKLFKLNYPYYTINDIRFRLLRDGFLSAKTYKKTMIKLFTKKKFDYLGHINKLYLNKTELKKLYRLGHQIGLHSHYHDINIKKLNYNKQFNTYNKNLNYLSDILKINKSEIKSMSHPLGNYNEETLEVLKKLNIQIGFRDNLQTNKLDMKKINNTNLEISRVSNSIFNYL